MQVCPFLRTDVTLHSRAACGHLWSWLRCCPVCSRRLCTAPPFPMPPPLNFASPRRFPTNPHLRWCSLCWLRHLCSLLSSWLCTTLFVFADSTAGDGPCMKPWRSFPTARCRILIAPSTSRIRATTCGSLLMRATTRGCPLSSIALTVSTMEPRAAHAISFVEK